MTSSPSIRAGFLTICPSPYIQDLFVALDQDARIDPIVYYQEELSPAFSWEPTALPPYATMLPSRIIKFMGARLFYNSGAVGTIAKQPYDIFVVGGYASITSQLLMRWLNKRRIPWVFWGEVPGFQNRGRLGSLLRKSAMRPVLKHCGGVAAVGQRAAENYRTLLGDNRPVATIPYYNDVRAFANAPRTRDDDTVNILFCGQLVERKGIRELFRVAIDLMKEIDLTLTILGDGDLEQELRDMVPVDYCSRVNFEGFQQTHALPAYFANADIFALPSRHDGWGVVINQALAAGLPIVSTNAVGAALDLVDDGVNGRIVSAGEQLESQLETAIRQLALDSALRRRMGDVSRQIVASWTATEEAGRWRGLFDEVLASRTGNAGS